MSGAQCQHFCDALSSNNSATFKWMMWKNREYSRFFPYEAYGILCVHFTINFKEQKIWSTILQLSAEVPLEWLEVSMRHASSLKLHS